MFDTTDINYLCKNIVRLGCNIIDRLNITG